MLPFATLSLAAHVLVMWHNKNACVRQPPCWRPQN